MGPAYGTEEYLNQVKTIIARIEDVADLGEKAIQQTVFMFISDSSYSRAAICQAEKEARRNNVVHTTINKGQE
jgi:hypothetical protein